jgi:NAD(P)-dependent dehydrogenase (short-subunit alcohol dehydrogenase family)
MNRSRRFFHQAQGKSASGGASSPVQSEPKPRFAEELAPAYGFLASAADSSFITGTVLHVAGEEIAG